jgi:hypothetical protein
MEQNKIAKRAQLILDIAKDMAQDLGWQVDTRIDEIQLHYDGYAEPGYYEPTSGIIATGNWNKISSYNSTNKIVEHISNLPCRISSLFEKMGIEIEWSSEWEACCDCGKLVRTQPDSYSWTKSYQFLDGEGVRCIECLEEDPEAYLETLEGISNQANTMHSIDPCKHGYVKVNEDTYESGWHPGQHDDPVKVAKELRNRGIDRFLFGIDSVGQFDSKWSVYVHQDEADLLNDICPNGESGIKCDCNTCAVETTAVSPPELVKPKKEVPCKLCKTSLFEDESPCWKCGTESPTK